MTSFNKIWSKDVKVSLCLLPAPLSRRSIFPDWWIKFVPQLDIPAGPKKKCKVQSQFVPAALRLLHRLKNTELSNLILNQLLSWCHFVPWHERIQSPCRWALARVSPLDLKRKRSCCIDTLYKSIDCDQHILKV